MKKSEIAMLEKTYSAEVEGALNNYPWMMQTRSLKTAKKLVDDGLLQQVTEQYHGVTISGYELTELGRLVYCMQCK